MTPFRRTRAAEPAHQDLLTRGEERLVERETEESLVDALQNSDTPGEALQDGTKRGSGSRTLRGAVIAIAGVALTATSVLALRRRPQPRRSRLARVAGRCRCRAKR